MKIFEKGDSSYPSKVNFVDRNDVFVGYDLKQSCCEDAGYYIAEDITPYDYESTPTSKAKEDLEGYVFEIDFFEELEGGRLDEGNMVVFKLIKEGKPDLYLHLYNCHNGYYSHGFEVKLYDDILRQDYL